MTIIKDKAHLTAYISSLLSTNDPDDLAELMTATILRRSYAMGFRYGDDWAPVFAMTDDSWHEYCDGDCQKKA